MLDTSPAPATQTLARLTTVPRGGQVVVARVEARPGTDPVALRLEDLGFVAGEPVRVIALGPFGGDPLVVQVGFTRFALRRSEAERVLVQPATGAGA